MILSLPPDMAHELALWAFRRRMWTRLSVAGDTTLDLSTSLAGIHLTNPIGLAAGFDKNGEITASMASLGFGFIVTGSVRARRHVGNPRPWFVRRLTQEGIVNSMGLPSEGAAYVRERLARTEIDVPLLISIVGENVADILHALEPLKGIAAGMEINLSCPNTETGRTFEEDSGAYTELLDALEKERGPLFLKLSPYEDETGRERALEMASAAIRRGIANFTLCNTLPTVDSRLGTGQGGLSGRPIFPMACQAVRDFYSEWGERVHIIGVGGIMTGREAYQMLLAGASALEVLTALILRGPWSVGHMLRELQDEMGAAGIGSLEELRGRAS